MAASVIERIEFPQGHTVFFGVDGKVIMTPQSEEHSATIKSMQLDAAAALGRRAKAISDVYIDFPADENSAPDFAIIREDAQHVPVRSAREGRRYSFEDVLLIAEVVSTSSVRTDYDECTVKYARYGVPIYLVVDPYQREAVVHTRPSAEDYDEALVRRYGSGKLSIALADGRTFTLDLDELPVPADS
jgi:Uma2 family endonuclease